MTTDEAIHIVFYGISDLLLFLDNDKTTKIEMS